jgi:hypothetical protein
LKSVKKVNRKPKTAIKEEELSFYEKVMNHKEIPNFIKWLASAYIILKVLAVIFEFIAKYEDSTTNKLIFLLNEITYLIYCVILGLIFWLVAKVFEYIRDKNENK